MNGPSLRGCGASMGKNTHKNRTSSPPPPLKIDPSKLNHLKSLDVDLFLNAPNVTIQLDFMKSFIKHLKDNNAHNDYVESVIIIFLESPLKHPLKVASSKMLTSIENNEKIVSLTYSKLQIMVQSANMNDVELLNNICNSISSSIELFPLNVNANEEFIVNTLDFLKNTLQKHIEILSSQSSLSPTKKMEHYLYIHNTSRVIISVMQKNNYKLNELWLNETCQICDFFINQNELPTDTKGNLAIILIITLNMQQGSKTWLKVLEDIFVDGADSKRFGLNDSDIVKLIMLTAVLNIANINELCSESIDGLPASIFICNNLIKLSSISSVNPMIILGSARSIMLISKSIFKASDEIAVIIAHTLLNFIWTHLDYYVDSVRHLTVQILSNIVKLALVLDDKGNRSLSSTLIKSIVDVPDAHSINFRALICLGSAYNCSYLLQKNDSLPSYMLSNIENSTDSANITSAFDVLMSKHRREVGIKVFFSTWVDPILNKLSLFDSSVTDSSLTSSILSGILFKAVKLDPQILPLLIPILNEDFSEPSDGKIKCTLVCLNVARKYGYLDSKTSTDKIWKDVIPFDLLHIAVLHQNAEIRLLTFSLMVESHKSTEYFDDSEFQLIKKFFRYNINVKSPNLHQKILSVIKKLFQRWQSGFFKCSKIATDEDNLSEINSYYMKFIDDICVLCLKNIFPDANFTRKNISTQILIMCQEICNKNNFESGFWKTDHVTLLFEYLNDSYECNKQLALSLLILCPFKHDLFNCENTWLEAFEIAMFRASSVKPTECMSSAYKLELLINKHPENIFQLYEKLGLEDVLSKLETPYLNHYNTIKLLFNILEKEKDVAEKSILLAAANGPMYGLLYCIRHLLGKVDMKLISRHRCWSKLIEDIIRLSFDISKAVELIVNNSSPEGHLPMDFDAGSLHIEKNGVRLEGGKSVTAQMVLLCAWRSIKEVSLILGDVSNQSVIMKDVETDDPQNGTITKQQMLDIGDHFITLLSETKHRGAFEQAYVGFSKLCLRLWKCDSVDLHNLPKIWLNDLITAISSGNSDNSKLCATRRSAGVPFIIQALVTTELQINNSPQSFQSCITTLLNLSQLSVNEDTRRIETKVHCLNILRALYRHAALGEHVNQYVTEGLIISINGFDGATWAERNASTLLFSSLITRIFGVQRTKNSDQLSIRNKMTGRIFFLRYPKLYDFLLNSLKTATECQKDYSLRPSMYPILLLLSRLYPSSLEGTDSNLKLIAFIPYLVWCAGNCVLKIRQLAAKAIVPLISQEWYFMHIIEMFKLIENKNHTHNFKHGIFLQLIKLLQHLPDNLKLDVSNFKYLADILGSTYGNFIQTSQMCFTLSSAYLKVVCLTLKRFPEIIKLNNVFFQALKSTSFEEIDFKSEIAIGMDEFYVETLNLKLNLIPLMDIDRIPEIFKTILRNMMHPCCVVVQRNLKYILCLYYSDNLEEIEEKFDISNNEKSFVSQLSPGEISEILKCFASSVEFKDNMFSILKDSVSLEDREKSLIILSRMPDTMYRLVDCSKSSSDDAILENLVSCFESEHEQINYIYLNILDVYLTKNFNEKFIIHDIFGHDNIKKLLTILKECGNEQQKNATINIIVNHWKLFDWNFEEIDEKYFEIILLQWSTIIQLSRDSNELIASKMHTLSKIILCESKYKCKLSQNFWKENCRSMIMNENGAIETFFEYLAELMLRRSFEHSIAALIILAIGENDSYEFSQDEQLIFDKMEDRNNSEECELTFMCLDLIEKIIKGENVTKSKREIILENRILIKWSDAADSSLNKLFDCLKYAKCDSVQNFPDDSTDFKIRELFKYFNEK